MKKLQPAMARMQASATATTAARQQQELMELYKKETINPIAGCLPIVRADPSGVLRALQGAVRHHRDAPCAILRWIKDSSAPDPTTVFNLFGLLPLTWCLWSAISMLVLATHHGRDHLVSDEVEPVSDHEGVADC